VIAEGALIEGHPSSVAIRQAEAEQAEFARQLATLPELRFTYWSNSQKSKTLGEKSRKVVGVSL
jgi:hypothetical protein